MGSDSLVDIEELPDGWWKEAPFPGKSGEFNATSPPAQLDSPTFLQLEFAQPVAEYFNFKCWELHVAPKIITLLSWELRKQEDEARSCILVS